MYIISLVLVADLIDIILDLVLVSENLVSPSRTNLLISILRRNLELTYGMSPAFSGGVHLFI